MCKVCDNIWTDDYSCKGIRYDEDEDLEYGGRFTSDCGDAYYDFGLDYCYRCGKKLTKGLVKQGVSPERKARLEKERKENPSMAKAADALNKSIAEQLAKATELQKKFLDGDPEARKQFFENMSRRLQFGQEMHIPIKKLKKKKEEEE